VLLRKNILTIVAPKW